MKALNYLRQAKANWAGLIAKHGRENVPLAGASDMFFDLANSSQKFILPRGGRIFNDKLRGIDELVRLPFARCLIEYEPGDKVVGQTGLHVMERCSRRIVFVEQAGDHLYMLCMFFWDAQSQWVIYPLAARFRASISNDGGEIEFSDVSGCGLGSQIKAPDAVSDFVNEIRAVFELIEALSCSNVEAVNLPEQKLNKSAARRGALPFDSYKTLTVRPACATGSAGDSDRRAPREHLRRGHIRRLPNGNKIWIQSCVVSAGAAGRIDKNYDLRRFA